MSTPTREDLIQRLKAVQDPEIPINVWDLGLIYRLDVKDDGCVALDFTLTNPACPLGRVLEASIRAALSQAPGVKNVSVQLVMEPAWSREKMTEDGRLYAAMYGLG